jgi:hypothetical protein
LNISFAPTALAKGWIDQTTAVFAHVVLMHLRERVRALLDAGCAGRDDERRYKRYAQWGSSARSLSNGSTGMNSVC